ncbi:LacI family DNA-binding transcriptional regulator [Bacteroides pyogenes]|uniref:LacI family DNA-binding transcriptional regulator n=1 Tax=Bacteroides pyogenes TaxID=310300 RepID=UPI001BA63440|nr:LacI family DNA-binding transcriptional regulator [Bacteroides pyogenes]MBR8724649.1 HTH-type transcriptional repressor CytR [Bacteroides pyogenes]MBR8738055.1 HTH-type transcriptional repressor CytR [Bacteroides pyogenes]MBR8753793.1 HTH-type transcriptional repressor CytR [Bacteroides pyogenes]MBR8795294.1 HTH-type transcriptional repressor CytR [Bacteroides pyogenes]MBR8808587.1 HTH-type transcriptional repressor CytR [Bacteroides pyogenes]
MKYTTIIDIAKELGISKSTVSRALRGDDYNVSKETRQKILETANRLGYKRNELAVNLRMQSTRTIGIVVPEMITPFYMKFITHAQEILNKAGYRVTLAQSHEDPEAERLNLQMMEDYRVEGILISVCHDKKNREFYQIFLDKGIPLVFFDRTVEDISAPKVKINDYIKAFFMVEHLIRNGKKHIIHLAGPSYIQNAKERKKGYKDALEKFRLPCPPEYIVDAGVNFTDGKQAVEALIKKGIPFDAIFCFTEMSALGAKSCLQRYNYHIPEEVAICCISGTELCMLVHPSVTTVEQPVMLMAEEASRLIMEKIENFSVADETVILEAEMVVRGSTLPLT